MIRNEDERSIPVPVKVDRWLLKWRLRSIVNTLDCSLEPDKSHWVTIKTTTFGLLHRLLLHVSSGSLLVV